MAIFSAIVRELVNAGVTGDALVTALERIEQASTPKRTAAAERMVAYRLRKKEAESVTGDARVTLVSPKEIPPTPPKEITPSPELRSEKTPTRVRASRIPENFVPDVQAAYDAGLSEDQTLLEVANFLDYWRSKPTNATKLDWPATWRVWCRKAAKDRGTQTGRGPPRQRSQNGFAAFALELSEQDRNGPRVINGFASAGHAANRSGNEPSPPPDRLDHSERPDKAGEPR